MFLRKIYIDSVERSKGSVRIYADFPTIEEYNKFAKAYNLPINAPDNGTGMVITGTGTTKRVSEDTCKTIDFDEAVSISLNPEPSTYQINVEFSDTIKFV